MKKVAIVVKSPSRFDFKRAFDLPDAEVFTLTTSDTKRVLVRDIDIDIDVTAYDFVILVGSEAAKYFTKVTSITDYTGRLAPSKNGLYNNFIISVSPQAMAFKPEIAPIFEATKEKIKQHLGGIKEKKIKNELVRINDSYILAEATIKRIRDELLEQDFPVLAFDTETTALYARKGYILGLSLSHTTDFGTYIHADVLTDKALSIVQEMIDNHRVNIVGHNLKFDMHMTEYHFNFNFAKAFEENRMHDTMVQHYLLDERQGTHGLKQLAMKYTDLGAYDDDLDEFKKSYCKANGIKEAQFTYDLIPWEVLSEYAALDTVATIRLFHKFYPLIKKNYRLDHIYTNIMMPAIEMLTEVEDNGVPVSVARLHVAKDLLNGKIRESTVELYSYPSVNKYEQETASIFNPNSPLQLRKLLYDYEGLQPVAKLTDSGALSTDAEVLEKLSEQSGLARVILDIRKNSKLLSSFVEKMIDNVDPDGYLRTGFNITSTTSGRLSSSGTINLQQLPSRDHLIKGCIRARKGYKIVALDMSTAEVWVAAALSKDPLMCEIFRKIHEDPVNNPDYHSLTAATVFPVNCLATEVKKKAPHWRQASKGVIFSVLYGSGAESLAEYINKELMAVWHKNGADPVDEPDWFDKQRAQEVLDNYFKRFPVLKRWIDKVHRQIKERGFLYGFFGRKRRLPNFNSSDKGIIAECMRSGLNALPQGASSDIMLQAAINMNKRIKANGWDIKILALVHDSMVMEVREDLVSIAETNAAECIQQDYFGYDGDDAETLSPLKIDGAPMGYGIDSEKGGSDDYAFGALQHEYPMVWEVDCA